MQTLKFIVDHLANRDHRLAAPVRFAKWQVGSRLVPGAIAYDWINGARFLVRHGETGLTGNIYTGLHEFPDMAYLLHVLRPRDLFVDVGANAGSYTVLACAAVGASGVAFEPVPDTFQRLRTNVRLNDLDNRVELRNQGLGDVSGKIAFTRDEDCMNHALAAGETDADAIEVPVVALDDALRGRTPALIKIDVEGYETKVLAGAHEILQSPALHSVIMELNGSGNRYGFEEAPLVKLLFDCGFGAYSYDPFTRALKDLGGKNAASGNTPFVRNRPFVEDRLRTAKANLFSR